MKRPKLGTDPLFLGEHEIVVDNFAGGGGASEGIGQAFGRAVDVAINHDPEAVAMHAINHPATRHYCESVFDVDPIEITEGKPVALAWFSPDCKHFSKAKGGKPVEKKIRGLAWIVIRWARVVKPRVIMLENVEEFQDWGPLTDDGLPCPLRKGKTFTLWTNQLRACGYRVEFRELRGCDYGAPTIRKRLFVIARRDGLPIVWPKPTHGAGLKPYRTAAECIDWTIPCPSIFERERPLADNTLRRIARGIQRFVIDAADPFIIGAGGPARHGAPRPVTGPARTVLPRNHSYLVTPFVASLANGDHAERPGLRANSADEPLRTIHAGGGNHALVAPFLVQRYGEREGQDPRCRTVEAPIPTIVPTDNHGHLVTAFLAQHNTGLVGHSVRKPVSTIIGKGCTQGLVTSHLMKMRGDNVGSDVREPVHTVSAQGNHFAEVRAFLMKFYGEGGQWQDLRDPLHTATAKPRFGLVTVHGEEYAIVDIGMRMLTPRELYNAQGFPAGYVIDFPFNGKPLPKSSQVRMCGNSVCPPVARALVAANCTLAVVEEVAA